MLAPDFLLQQIASMLRNQLAPALDDDSLRTQAHMSALVLDRVARQFASVPPVSALNADEKARLMKVLDQIDDGDYSVKSGCSELGAVSARVRAHVGNAELAALVSALYGCRGSIRAEVFDELLGEVRWVLRSQLDRQLEIAR